MDDFGIVEQEAFATMSLCASLSPFLIFLGSLLAPR